MSVADVKYKQILQEILDNGVWDTDGEVRPKYADGKPAYSKSIFGVQVKFDNGEVPILTTKKVAWKTAIKEMLLFWVMQTNRKDDFKRFKVKIWDEWFNNDGNLGRSYPFQFESHHPSLHKREVVKVDKVLVDASLNTVNKIVVNPIKQPNYSSGYKRIGHTLSSKNFGDFIILDYFPKGHYYKNESSYKIQFKETGYIDIVRGRNANRGSVRDPYRRTVSDIGYWGDINHERTGLSKKQYKNIRDKWVDMIKRCYKPNIMNTKYYKDNDIFVHPDWHNFSKFLKDIKYVPQYFLAKNDDFEGWSIDKDYFGSNAYSKDSCVFLKSQENNIYKNRVKPIRVKYSDGKEDIYLSQTEMAKDFNTIQSTIQCWLNGSNKGYKKYDIIDISIIDDNDIYRYELSKNQVVDLINNIKNNPNSRRIMTNFFNFADMDKKSLVECAYSTLWNVKDGKLDMILIQRSGDVGLGIPFNQFQYYVLLNMVAQCCGLEVGSFIHQIGNIHYYDRHEDILKIQMKATEYDQPMLRVNSEVKDFFDFTLEDFELIDYNHGEALPMEVAI